MSEETPGQDPKNGRFLPGNKMGLGNSGPSKVAKYRAAFHRAVSEEDMEAIAAKVLEMAKAGDISAARFIADYTLGKPQPVEISDGEAVASVPNALVINLVPPDRG